MPPSSRILSYTPFPTPTLVPAAKPIVGPLPVARAAGMLGTAPAPSSAQSGAASPNAVVQINTGRGRLVTLPAPMSDLFVADPGIADVQVRSPTQLYVFGKAPGETTVYATTKAGKVVYSSTVRVGNTLDSVQQMLSLALPAARRSEERSVGREC